MFYDRYMELCQRNDEKPYALAVELGAKSNSVVAQWKKGSAPRADMLQKIADHFGVTVGFLLTGESNTNELPAFVESGEVEDEETIELLEIWGSSNQEDKDFLIATARMLKARRKNDESH